MEDLDEIWEYVQTLTDEQRALFFVMIGDDVYMKTDKDIREEAGMSRSEQSRMLRNRTFMDAVNDAVDMLTEDSMYKVLRARLAFSLTLTGVKDRDYMAKRYLDEEVGGGEQIVINNNIPNPDEDDAI